MGQPAAEDEERLRFAIVIIVLLVPLLLGTFAARAVLEGGDAGMFKCGTWFDGELFSCSSCSRSHVLTLGDPDINGSED